jgi:hypothetical protein
MHVAAGFTRPAEHGKLELCWAAHCAAFVDFGACGRGGEADTDQNPIKLRPN